MQIAPVGIACPFEVTFNSASLPVAISVYDVSSGTPILVQGPTAMENVVGFTYFGSFTPPFPKQYIIFKAVYTDSTFTTLNLLYSQGSESIIAQNLAYVSPSPGSFPLVGVIEVDPLLVNC